MKPVGLISTYGKNISSGSQENKQHVKSQSNQSSRPRETGPDLASLLGEKGYSRYFEHKEPTTPPKEVVSDDEQAQGGSHSKLIVSRPDQH